MNPDRRRDASLSCATVQGDSTIAPAAPLRPGNGPICSPAAGGTVARERLSLIVLQKLVRMNQEGFITSAASTLENVAWHPVPTSR
jgi:hypothetical protein